MRIKKKYESKDEALRVTYALCREEFDATRRGNVVTLTTTFIAVDFLVFLNDWVTVV